MALLFRRVLLEARVAVIFVVVLLAMVGTLVRLTVALVHQSLSAALHHRNKSSKLTRQV